MVVSEMDTEEVNSSVPPEIFRERTLLIREALILLNRLVSNPQYSTPVLRILTNSRDTACLTVDITKRLSCSDKWLWQHDSTARQMRESKIVVLARVFRKRVFTFLGYTMSWTSS
ncbi:protein SENSITIVE TO UV 2-like [Rhododendron vialii]|uniref:protein SENSITIVE TO UV 2-like n=1 Tax=Rhododendron vialii TaxID=182163 RepID=UPI00265E06F0|nr:protein SENSITIVE TO UV 2-like [Rhododendron vialii]